MKLYEKCGLHVGQTETNVVVTHTVHFLVQLYDILDLSFNCTHFYQHV